MNNLLHNLYAIAGIVFKPSEYSKFLDLAAKFPNLNLYNMLLLYYQKKDAVLIAGENAWKDNYDIDVQDDALAIGLVRPTIIDENDTTIGYDLIAVFDISQLKRQPDIKQEEFSIQDFFYDATHMSVEYDNENILSGNGYEFIGDDVLLVPFYEGVTEEERNRLVNKQLLCAYVENYCSLGNDNLEDKLRIQSVEYILCRRYGLKPTPINNVFISNCSSINTIQFLISVVETVGQVIDLVENRDSVELNFADMAFINLLIEANCREDYEKIEEYDVEDDDNLLRSSVEQFMSKMETLSQRDYNRIYEDRKNNKMLTQPPYRLKLLEEY